VKGNRTEPAIAPPGHDVPAGFFSQDVVTVARGLIGITLLVSGVVVRSPRRRHTTPLILRRTATAGDPLEMAASSDLLDMPMSIAAMASIGASILSAAPRSVAPF
jgi:hypothetical protein